MNFDKINFSGKKVTVMGLGAHGGGLGNVRWLYKQGAEITVTDLRNEQELTLQLKEIKKLDGVKVVLGKHRQEDFINVDIVVQNPAVPRDSKYLQIAKKAGASIEMDSSIFFKLIGKENIIGVTGSKGKTTTTSAIAQILGIKKVGVEGISPLEEINNYNGGEKIVFELSSWRLEALNDQKISPAIAVVTSIYKDHLNTYESFSEYKNIKKSIIKYQKEEDIAILNVDDEELRQWAKNQPSRVFGYSIEDRGYSGIFLRDGFVVVRIDGKEERVIPERDIPLKYVYAKRNILPGILLAVIEGVDREEIRRSVKKVVPLPHRMEEVRIYNDIRFINDSAATVPDATIVALQALAKERIVHIVGGNDKELDWEKWAMAEVNANIKEMIWLPGDATEKMRQEYMQEGGQIEGIEAKSMQQAVELATQAAEKSDVVLLSPAATSFGLFKNEFDRGDTFKGFVNAL